MSVIWDRLIRPDGEPDLREPSVAVIEMPAPNPAGLPRFEYLSGDVAGRYLNSHLNGYGKDGWQVRVCAPNRNAVGNPDGTFFVMLERKLESTGSDGPVRLRPRSSR
jgi:hypothetical protein